MSLNSTGLFNGWYVFLKHKKQNGEGLNKDNLYVL